MAKSRFKHYWWWAPSSYTWLDQATIHIDHVWKEIGTICSQLQKKIEELIQTEVRRCLDHDLPAIMTKEEQMIALEHLMDHQYYNLHPLAKDTIRWAILERDGHTIETADLKTMLTEQWRVRQQQEKVESHDQAVQDFLRYIAIYVSRKIETWEEHKIIGKRILDSITTTLYSSYACDLTSKNPTQFALWQYIDKLLQ
jgi:hypothetical protein